VRAEARATDGKSLTVLVAGSTRPAATSTMAVALASRFAQSGLSVVLIDADQHTGSITHEFRADEQGGIPAFLARSADVNSRSRNRNSATLDDTFGAFTETSIAGVEVLGLGPIAGRAGLRRTDVPELLSGAMAHAHVVVIDGGALLEAATTMQFAQMVDTIVLTVPMKSQQLDGLEDIADQLGTQRMKSVLPVITHPARRR
jgi:Mrp family chromosome partitioning ATPase